MLFTCDEDTDGPRPQNARKWFAENGPPDLQPLPLGYTERELCKRQGEHILAWYASSLECRDYDYNAHPSFDDFACGLMASEFVPYFIATNAALKKRFPRRKLAGIGPGLLWAPPKTFARITKADRRFLASTERTREALEPRSIE
jgi:hypothetical protein